jgi:hypothetical protein
MKNRHTRAPTVASHTLRWVSTMPGIRRRPAASITSTAEVAGSRPGRGVEFAMRLPRYEAIAQAIRNQSRQPAVRAYLEEFAMTKRQFASQQ